ncbi:hypothetical protein EB796_012928 [Bugula neritina]|uniref:Zinc finger PHD-type domain-containing protein n=1 Tax=Bugula neritina TaxID=10212 RepID=A0A7J7JSY6_BUGNE|nr:hypothetical protein EB796_012928 [Bugula neritina]
MLRIGIYIPDRDASWELVPGAYNSLLQPNLECVADVCICPQGRSEDETDGEWELIMCETCGCQAVHTQCGKLKKKDKEWLCSMCRGTASGSSKENEVPHEPKRLDLKTKDKAAAQILFLKKD